MLLNNQGVTEKKIKDKIKKYLETNENEKMVIQNVCDTVKAVLRGKIMAIQSYLRKQGKPHINNLTMCLNQLEKVEETKANVSRRKEIIKIRAKNKFNTDEENNKKGQRN